MYGVAIAFTDGTKVHFYAQAFDFDPDRFHDISRLHKISYTDHDGNDSSTWLTPNKVSGVVVAPVNYAGASVITYQ